MDGYAPIEVLTVRGNIYMLAAGGRNITLSVGLEGVMLVDTALAPWADQIVAAIQKLTNKPVRYVLNTNADADHTGGNAIFANRGRPAGTGGAGAPMFFAGASGQPPPAVFPHINAPNRTPSSAPAPPPTP